MQGERRACPLCGTLRCVACNGVHKEQVSRFFNWRSKYPQHNVILMPVFHRHEAIAADHHEQALILAKHREVQHPLQGFDYTQG